MNIIVRPGLANRTFEASDQDTGGTVYYFGFLTQDGNWTILAQDNTATPILTYRYASPANNSGYSSYPEAWAARASLTYDYFNLAKI